MAVQYQELTPLLLNQVQRQPRQIEEQTDLNRQRKARLDQQARHMAQLRAMFEQAMTAYNGARLASAAPLNAGEPDMIRLVRHPPVLRHIGQWCTVGCGRRGSGPVCKRYCPGTHPG